MGIIFDKPLIGVVMCQINRDGHPTQMVHNKYLTPVITAGGVPLALPHDLLAQPGVLDSALNALQGILLTGSPSNIEPHHYGESGTEADADPGRDRLAFTLIRQIIARNMPLLAICRGLQELVVATGGSLHRQLHLQPDLQDHREDSSLPLAQQYASAHAVWVEPGGLLASITRDRTTFQVNSLHQQGIRDPGPLLRVEARAADGLAEAVSLTEHPFALAVQWHPEWHDEEAGLSQRIFSRFIHACQHYQQETRL
ncbi:gamma-glutamyl-gamma-aminobutyrate hydrolase [Erwinia sp. V71]|uniref:gamma-glutamyl-gamma-aminobutyrate hydrolase n=1 Tax=Erwinia sp. V71 TaxID=3369424 RepID=UPI003F632E50